MSIEYRKLEVGPLGTNCYIIWDAETCRAAVIDPGGNRDEIVDCVEKMSLDVEWVLLTHRHPDHIFSTGDLANKWSARIGMHESDYEHLAEMLDVAEMFYDVSKYVHFTPSDFLKHGDTIQLGASQINILHTPGHSQGGICFVTDAGVFCGDTIFASSIGRTDFPGGSHPQIIESIKTHILTLPPETPLYPGHGPATTVGVERKTNPFLQ